MARAEEIAAPQQQHASHQRALRSVIIAVCTVACFVAFCGFVLNQQGAGKSTELEGTQTRSVVATSTKASISAQNKLTSKTSLDEDAIDWAEEEAENKLIAGLEDKIRAKFSQERTVEAHPLQLLNRSDVEADIQKKIEEQNFKVLVSKITGEMQAVNGNLDTIAALRQKQEDLEEAIASVTDDINSDETKELFDEIARLDAIEPEEDLNGTLCGNGTDADFNCTGNETSADADAPADEEEPAAERARSVQTLAAHRAHPAAAARRPRVAIAAKRIPAAARRAPHPPHARHEALFEDVARVLRDEEHRVKQFGQSMKKLGRAAGRAPP